jgi:micrococcal nuclease
MCYKRLNHRMALLLLFIILHSVNALAETLTGKVVSVADGDTITMLDASNTQHKIRLSGIDAPEKRQAFGNQAKQYLAKLCFGKAAEAIIETKDSYGRYVAEVYCESINANESLLSEGLAWVYTQYAKKFPHYKDLEDESRLNHIGLWADTNPVPPWKFRRNKL